MLIIKSILSVALGCCDGFSQFKKLQSSLKFLIIFLVKSEIVILLSCDD